MDSLELENIQYLYAKYCEIYHNPELAMELALEECGWEKQNQTKLSSKEGNL